MSAQLKKSLVVQGSILAIAGLITKVIGFIYRIPMANILGNVGNGLYSVAFGIYNIALTLSSYSMPLAVSKLMSARLAKGQYKNAYRLFRCALIFAIITGSIACCVLFFGAEFLAAAYKKQGLEYPLRVLAPTVFVVALLGTCRGFFQGHRNMVPTAVSQVIEQIVNAVVSVVAASALAKIAMTRVGGAEGNIPAAAAAAGGTLGTFAGAFTALLMFVVISLRRQKARKIELSGDDLADEDYALITRAILLTVFPVILSQTIYQIGYTLDDYIFPNLMMAKGFTEDDATCMQGVFNTQYNQMVNLPVAIATAMASATLPSIVASFAKGEMDHLKEKISSVLKLNMLIAIPAAAGLTALAEPVMGVLFPRLGEYMSMAVMLLRTGSIAVVFYALSTLTTSILQGSDRMRLPVIHSAISLSLHVIIVACCVKYTDLGVYSLIVGNVTFPLLVCTLNCRSVAKRVDYRFAWMNTFIKPAVAAIVMGGAAFGIYMALTDALGMLVAMIVAMAAAVAIYGGMLLVLKAVTMDELKAMPLIGKFFRKRN
ncbi:MAG: polysaccharide biosynthesis protein [Lachnospiraceae bacterium]|nr:polysaccharide biosynthesis protein [Lachnospiraceae bacterium]